jgi:hypothetical protein
MLRGRAHHIGRLPDVVVRVHLRPNGTADSVVVVRNPRGTGVAMCLTTTIETMGVSFPTTRRPWVSYRFEGS